MPAQVTITVTPRLTDDDPPLMIFGVSFLRKEEGRGDEGWSETWGSAEHTEAFLRGVVAGVSMICGRHISVPPVSPRESTCRRTVIKRR